MNRFPTRSEPEAARPGDDRVQPRSDPLRKGVHLVMLLYLMPAVLAVLLLGGLLVLLERLARRIGFHAGPIWPGCGTRVRSLAAGGDGRSCDVPPEVPGAPRRDRGLASARGRRGD